MEKFHIFVFELVLKLELDMKHIVLILLLALGVASCNSGVFVDEPPLSEEILTATIEADGGEAEFKIPVKGLESISVDLFSEQEKYCTYYNAAGEPIDRKSPASEVSRIVFENDFMKFEIEKTGKKLIFKSVCNTSEYETSRTIRLEYTYGVRFIDITTTPGKPLEIVEITYPEPMQINERGKVVTQRVNIANDGPLPTTFEVRPYLNEFASILVEPERSGSWIEAGKMTMKVPMFENGSWEIKEKSGIRPGTRYTYEGPDRFTKITVDIPADSKVTVITDVIYTQAIAKGYIVYLNEILDRRIVVNFTVTSLYPAKHEIRIEDAK